MGHKTTSWVPLCSREEKDLFLQVPEGVISASQLTGEGKATFHDCPSELTAMGI